MTSFDRIARFNRAIENLSEPEFDRLLEFIEAYSILEPRDGDTAVFKENSLGTVQLSTSSRTYHPVYKTDDCVVASTLVPNEDWKVVVYNPNLKSTGYL